MKWLAKYHSIIEGRQFISELERGPFRNWVHLHLFTNVGEGLSELENRIDYEFPLGKLGQVFARSQVQRKLNTVFPWRHERTWMDLSRHTEFADQPRLRIAVSGATGLIGSSLKLFLTTGGHTILTLDRKRGGDENSIYWNPRTGEIEGEKLENLDAVVHLAGRNIAGGRWTGAAKREILGSRVDGTQLLAKTIAGLKQPPEVFVSASAIGIYANSSDPVDETGAQGEGFLVEVCRAWEEAANPAREAGIRVVHPRIGNVISGRGGVLGKLLPFFRYGLGGRMGHGRQMMSWIQLDDLTAAIYRCIYDGRLSGPVNATTQAVTNQMFTDILGSVLRRPTLAFVPEVAVNLVFGQMGRELLLQGQHVEPDALRKVGFSPWFPDLESALRFETGKPFKHNPPFHPSPLPQSGTKGYLIS